MVVCISAKELSTVTLTGGLSGPTDWLAFAPVTAANNNYPAWTYVGSDRLPAAFARIPLGSAKADVRVFVAGTDEAREAVLDAVTNLVKEGLLISEGGGDFYRRTEEGRLALAAPRDVTMYMREGCHLCEEAKAAMSPVLAALGARLQEIDIDDDSALRARYTNDVPVIFIGPNFFAQHRVDAARLRRHLENAKL